MVCKLHEIVNFVREYNLLNDLSDEEIKENFELFPHACSWDKEIGTSQIDCDEVDVVVDKTLEILDLAFEHEYTREKLKEIAKTFCEVFDVAAAPRRPVALVVVLLSRL
ncbi:MAG: hypothetical protein OQK45_00225 [Sulfurovum sp.]|nr:hypothetical protein [Sulfurovum sp.]